MHDWRTYAACNEAGDPDIFFPDPTDEKTTALALSYCAVCPVLLECLKTGEKERHGIVGGLTEAQRASISRKRTRGTMRVRRAKTTA